MPKSTFYRLPEEKKTRILKAAEHEFLNHTFEEASINSIVKEAAIPRGSFYQYFEDKQDLFLYILDAHKKEVVLLVQNMVKECDGDLFAFMRKAADMALLEGCGHNISGVRRVISEPWVFNMVFCEKFRETMDGEDCPAQMVLETIDKEQLLVENEEELLVLIQVFSSMMFQLVFHIFVMGTDVSKNREKLRGSIFGEIDTLEKHYKKK